MLKTKVVLWGLEKMQAAASNLLGGLIREKGKIKISRENARLEHIKKTDDLAAKLALKQVKLDTKVELKFQEIAKKNVAIQTQIETVQSKVNV